MNGAQLATPADTLRARMVKPVPGVPPEKWMGSLEKGSFYIGCKLAAGWAILPDPMNRLLPEWLGAVLMETDPGDEQPDKVVKPPILFSPQSQGVVIQPKRRGRKPGSRNKPK